MKLRRQSALDVLENICYLGNALPRANTNNDTMLNRTLTLTTRHKMHVALIVFYNVHFNREAKNLLAPCGTANFLKEDMSSCYCIKTIHSVIAIQKVLAK